MSSPAKDHFRITPILGALFRLLMFALLTGIGIRLIRTDPKVGWASIVLFGTMGVLTIIDLVRQCGLGQNHVPQVKSNWSIRRVLVWVGVTLVTILLGLADHFISVMFSKSVPRVGVWFGTFVATLAFYPLRDGEHKEANFKVWIIFCALMGVASVVLSYVKDWL